MSSENVATSWPSIRKHIIKSAVDYIINPKSLAFSILENSKFLLEKGLTPEEVDLVLSIAGPLRTNIHNNNNSNNVKEIIIEKPSGGLVTLLSGSLASNQTFTGRLLNLTITGATWAALIYGLYKFYQNFVLNTERTVNDNIQENVQQINQEIHVLRAKLFDLIKTVNSVNDFVTKYMGKRDDNLLMLQKELTSIKSLLLNRSQFPDVPVIPAISRSLFSAESSSN